MDTLTPASIIETGAQLGMAQKPVWRLAAEQIEGLKAAMLALPQTLNYNDFYWTNLALSRRRQPPLKAIVFDYHLLGLGLRYSDYRNVAGSLGERARAAFWESVAPLDKRERIFDEPTSILYVLVVAARDPKLPRWAREPLEQAQNGVLEERLRRAIDLL